MFKKLFLFIFTLLMLLLPGQINAQGVYNDYRSDYNKIPAYSKTVQWIVESKGSLQTIYFRQNLGFSEDETAFIVPFKGGSVSAKVENKDVWKEVVDKTTLNTYFAEKTVPFTLQPKIYTKSTKDELSEAIKSKNYDIDNVYQKQIDDWFDEGLILLFFSVGPVSESRVTWTEPIKVELSNSKIEVPVVWLRPEYSKITTAKNKVIYAADFEGGSNGWQDEFQGEGANSLVTRDNSQHYEGNFSLKVLNKPGSINALTTQTLGPLTPGEHYTFSAYVKNGTINSGTASLRVMGDGLVQFTDGAPMYNGLGHQWQRVSMTFQAKSAYHFFTLMAGGDPGQYIFWDNVQLEKGTTASEFRKDKVGINNSTPAKEDLVTTRVDLDVMIFGDSAYSTVNLQLQKLFYKLEKVPEFLSETVLSSIRGNINPVDTAAFMQFEKSNDKVIPLSSQAIQPGASSNNNILLIVVATLLFLIIVIKHLLTLFLRIEGEKKVSLVFEILYFIGWFVNIISVILLSVYFYGQLVQKEFYSALDSASVFFITAFIISLSIYLITFTYFLRHNERVMKRISQVQIGVTIILLLISVSFVISDVYRMFQVINVSNRLVFFSNIPQLLLMMLELGVLIRLYTKVKGLDNKDI